MISTSGSNGLAYSRVRGCSAHFTNRTANGLAPVALAPVDPLRDLGRQRPRRVERGDGVAEMALQRQRPPPTRVRPGDGGAGMALPAQRPPGRLPPADRLPPERHELAQRPGPGRGGGGGADADAVDSRHGVHGRVGAAPPGGRRRFVSLDEDNDRSSALRSKSKIRVRLSVASLGVFAFAARGGHAPSSTLASSNATEASAPTATTRSLCVTTPTPCSSSQAQEKPKPVYATPFLDRRQTYRVPRETR